jgi:hypothetical protein
MSGVISNTPGNSPTLVSNPALSSNFSSQYDITRFLPYVEIQYSNGYVETIPDLLSWDFNKIINYCTTFSEVVFYGNVPLTTVVNRVYGTTSLLWLVVMYNGIIHPMEIPPGTIIRMPDIAQINAYLNNVQSNNGKVVVI